MSKEKMLKIGLKLQAIAMSVDDVTLTRIKPFLEEIENAILEEGEEDE